MAKFIIGNKPMVTLSKKAPRPPKMGEKSPQSPPVLRPPGTLREGGFRGPLRASPSLIPMAKFIIGNKPMVTLSKKAPRPPKMGEKSPQSPPVLRPPGTLREGGFRGPLRASPSLIPMAKFIIGNKPMVTLSKKAPRPPKMGEKSPQSPPVLRPPGTLREAQE